MKKILFVATVQSHIINFHLPYIELLQKKGYEVHVATKLDSIKYKDIYEKLENIKWINIDFTRSPISKDIFISYKQIKQYIKENKFELIHVNTPIASFITRLACRKTKNTSIIYTAHGFHFFKGSSIKNWLIYYTLEKIAARWTDAIITMNDEDYNLAKNKFESNKCSIYKINGIGVETKKYSTEYIEKKDYEKYSLKPTDFVVTIIGEINKNKNQKQIIDAIYELIPKYLNIKLLIVGEGDMSQEISLYIKQKGISSNIKMLGFRKDIPEILNISDIIVSCSYREGLPKNLIEAMMAKKALVCTDIRGNRDLIKNGENGILVEINNIEETKDAIETLYKNKELLDSMGSKSKKMSDKYSLSKVKKQMEEIYLNYL